MTSECLRQETVERLRQAAVSEEYDEVRAALADYRRHVDEAVAAWPPDGPPPTDLASEADQLMRYVLQVTRAARAQTSYALDQASTVSHYLYHLQSPTFKAEG
jgi:hypothetical protein